MDVTQYRRLVDFQYPERTWPDKELTAAPIWCSVDLRDGNQALAEPMDVERKRRMFHLLRTIGFKQIEVGFPSASQTDFDFLRFLIDQALVDDQVEVQVLTQSRPSLIERTIESLEGYPKSIIHLYNSTSPRQREWVFCKDREAVKKLAVDGTKAILDQVGRLSGQVRYQYSPESFTQTEMEFALEVCEAVMDEYRPTAQNKMIINLPATVEVTSAKGYADQIEWFCQSLSRRDCVDISAHTHNDRGQAVAATEFALLAGADRVEGTLFGNGERTGNVDLITLALNLYSHGIDPQLDFHNMPEVVKTAEYCNRMPVPERHPYAGRLVFTAFSGSHQDAIKKSLHLHRQTNQPLWDIPYLPINPEDLGCKYEEVIRINSQSGKGGMSFVLEHDYGYRLPRAFQQYLAQKVQQVSDQTKTEISSVQIFEVFKATFMPEEPLRFLSYVTQPQDHAQATDSPQRQVHAQLMYHGQQLDIVGTGNGPLDGFVKALSTHFHKSITINDYEEHAISTGSDSEAVSYVTLDIEGNLSLGIGQDSNIVVASLRAILSGCNRALLD